MKTKIQKIILLFITLFGFFTYFNSVYSYDFDNVTYDTTINLSWVSGLGFQFVDDGYGVVGCSGLGTSPFNTRYVFYTLSTQYDLSSAVLSYTTDLARYYSTFYMSDDGVNFFVYNIANGGFYHYELLTPYDIRTKSLVNSTVIVGYYQNMSFYDDGNILVFGYYTSIVVYTLSTPYDLTTITYWYTETSQYVFDFSSDGVFFYSGINNPYFNLYSLSVPFDIRTRVFIGTSPYISPSSTYSRKVDLNFDYSKFYYVVDSNIIVYDINNSYSPPSNKICEDYTSSIPTLTNEQVYKLQGQTFTNSGYVKNTTSGLNTHGFWFNKNNNGTGSFLNYFYLNLDNFDDVTFYNSGEIQENSTGGILDTFTQSGYAMIENYFFSKGTKDDPAIYINTFNKFQKINIKSSQTYAYRVYKKVEGEYTLILKNCVTNTICDISQTSSSLWYDLYDELLIVPFSTAGYVKFTDYRVDDIEVYSYTSEYLTYPVCFYEDGSIDVNGEDFTPEEWQEYKENEIKNGEPKLTDYCKDLNFFQYIKDPVCLSSGLSSWFQKNFGDNPAYGYFIKFLDFISYKIEPINQFKIYFFNKNIDGFNEYIIDLNYENLEFENYSSYSPDYESDNGKIMLFVIKGFFTIFFYILIFAFLYFVFFFHNFIFNLFLKIIKLAFPSLLEFNFSSGMNFISYIALIPLITVFLFLFNVFLFDYLIIFKNLFTTTFNIIGTIFDFIYGFITDDYGGFITSFNIIHIYLTGAFLIALFSLILIKFGRL